MPSHPPETELYNDPRNKTLWRDISRLYEDFCGSEPEDEAKWPERQQAFTHVLLDVHARLWGKPRAKPSEPLTELRLDALHPDRTRRQRGHEYDTLRIVADFATARPKHS